MVMTNRMSSYSTRRVTAAAPVARCAPQRAPQHVPQRAPQLAQQRIARWAPIRRVTALSLLAIGLLTVAGCSKDSPSDTVDPTLIDPLPAKRGLMPSIAMADSTFESNHYSGNTVCTQCHTNANDTSADGRTLGVPNRDSRRDVSIGTAWETSMMANSTRDPYWHAVVASELHRFPDKAEEINDTCTVCHAPMANDLAKKEGMHFQLFDTGSQENGDFVQGVLNKSSDDGLFNHAMDGVSCTFCHQIADNGKLGTDEGMSGQWTVNTFSDPDERPAYGQYTDPDGAYMLAQSGFSAKPSETGHVSTSELCGTCHNLKTTPLDTAGEPLPASPHFAEQMVYSEWENSDYNEGGSLEQSCQDCHMPKVDEPVRLATAGSQQLRENFREHTFLGANTVMQSMLHNNKEALGINPDIDFQPSIERNRLFLKTAATLEVVNTERSEDNLRVDVRVTNNTGHKLPSGYHSRRVYLHVLVTDGNGQVVYENGRIQQDGSIVGVSEDANPDSYETHYDMITSASQVQVYQAVTGNSDGDRTHSLLNASHYLKDNRLMPSGFDKATVSADIAVAGLAVDDQDFIDGGDTVSYQMPLGSTEGPHTVLIELRYQPMAYGSIADLFTESEAVDQVDMFRTIYDGTDRLDEVITTTIVEVP